MHNVQCINKCQGQSKLSLLGGEDSGNHDQWDSNYVPFVFTLESPEIFPSCFIFDFFTEVWITLHGNIKKSFFKKMRYVLLFTSYMWLEPVFFFISTWWQRSPSRRFMVLAFSNKCSRSTWLPEVRKWSGKIKFLQGQEKVREFHFESGNIYVWQKARKY